MWNTSGGSLGRDTKTASPPNPLPPTPDSAGPKSNGQAATSNQPAGMPHQPAPAESDAPKTKESEMERATVVVSVSAKSP